MSSIDEKIVEMTFKGTSFLSGVKNAISSLAGLKSALSGLSGAGKGLSDLENASKKVDFKGISDGADNASHHFDLMQIAGLTVFTKLVGQALYAGEGILKALTIDPIKAGLDVYETKINAIQTILANTSQAGTTLHQVTDALDQLNTYANKTVYNFGEMAKNIGTFTAAGVDLKTSVESIKGIANLAALSGSSAEQASTAMYQLSQSIAAGKVNLQDWNSVVNAGIGGKVFQNQLEETARATGVNIDAIIKKAGSFRNSLQEGWLTSDILTKTLSTFTGDLSVAQLKAMGYTNDEALAIKKQADAAVASATNIRTVTQLFQALKEEIATAFSRVFEGLFGNITEATAGFTAMHNVLENAFTGPINNLADFLKEFDEVGGRQQVIDTLKEAFGEVGKVLGTVKAAFQEVFPANGGSAVAGLLTLTAKFQNFIHSLEPSKQTLAEIKTVFVGVFSVFKLGIDVIEGVASVFGKMFGAIASGVSGGGGGGFLAFVATLASFVTKAKDAIESGGVLTKVFQVIGTVLAAPVKLIADAVGHLGALSGVFDKIVAAVKPFAEKIGNALKSAGQALGNAFSSGDLSTIVGTIDKVLFGGILLAVRNFIKNLGGGKKSGAGFLDTIKESFESLTGSLKALQTNLKAGTLTKIAIAVALLAGSMVAISLINVGNLTKALTAMTVLFTEMLGALAVISKIGGVSGIVSINATAVALNLLAVAMLTLSAAVAILSRFSWEELAKGLGSIAILLGELAAATKLMSGDNAGLLSSALAMIAMGVALNILALAVKQLGDLDFATLAKGIGSVAALLAIIAVFDKFDSGQMISSAAAMVILGGALNIIALAVKQLGQMSWDQLAKGLGSIAAVLLIIALAMDVMPPNMLLTAASLLIVSAALVILGQALSNMGQMSWSEIAKSLIELAGSLVIIAAAMILMTEALPGAAALLVVTASLAILTPILVTLGGLSWESIAKGLAALAGVFLILAAAGLLLTPLVPTLLLLGVAIALLGVGVLAAGVGVLAFAIGLTALAVAVTASGVAILSFVGSILSLIPLALAKVGEGIVAFAGVIAGSAGALTGAFVAVFTSILNAIATVVPLMGKTFTTILTTMINVVQANAPRLLSTFVNLLLQLLNSVNTNMPKFIKIGGDIVTNFLGGIAGQIPRVAAKAGDVCIAFINAVGTQSARIANAGEQAMINFINALTNSIKAHQNDMNTAIHNLAGAIISGLISGLASGASGVVTEIVNLAKSAIDAAKSILHINSPSKVFMAIGAGIPEGWALGVHGSGGLVVDSVEKVGNDAISALGNTMASIGQVLNDNMDLQPKITPVVDLTQAKAGFSELNGLSKSQLVAASGAAASAAAIATSQAAVTNGLGGIGGTSISFVQNNNSPKALSAGDIYRQTKSQLSIARGVIAGNANSG